MEHARVTSVCYCAHKSVEDTLGYQTIVQLWMDGLDVNWKFSNMFEKAEETNFKTNLVNVESCSFHKLRNAFLRKNSAVWIADFLKLYFNCITKQGLATLHTFTEIDTENIQAVFYSNLVLCRLWQFYRGYSSSCSLYLCKIVFHHQNFEKMKI